MVPAMGVPVKSVRKKFPPIAVGCVAKDENVIGSSVLLVDSQTSPVVGPSMLKKLRLADATN